MFNKKGQEEFLSVWWFLIITIIGVFISIGVIIFYSSAIDVKGIEAHILATKTADCFVQNGYLTFNLNSIDKSLIFEKCNLNKEILDSKEYYLGISFYGYESNQKLREPVQIGNPTFQTFCELEGKNYPTCVTKNIYTLNEENQNFKKLKIEISAGSNNLGG